MPAPGRLPACQFLVAFNNNTLDDPASITTIASPPGTLGAVNVWTDVSQWVRRSAWERGRQRETARFEAGFGSLTLVNFDGRFNPWNTSGPYTGLITIGKPFRIQMTPTGGSTYIAFTGHTKTWTPQWPDQVSATMLLEFVDAFALFALSPLVSTAYATQVVTDGATGYYKLNERPGPLPASAGASFADSSGHARTGVQVVGANALVLGQTAGPALLTADTAVDFGSYTAAGGQSHISLSGIGLAPSGNASWSFECWVQTSATGWVAGQNGNATTQKWTLAAGGGGVQATFVNSGVPGPYVITHPLNVQDGVWHHIVVTYNGSTNGAILYVDGTTFPGSTITVAGGMNLAAGADLDLGSFASGAGSSLGGIRLGHCSFYPTVLSAAQVTNHLSLGVGFAQGASGTQIGAALNLMGWPAGARNIDTGSSMCMQNAQNLTKTAGLSYMQLIEQTEDGALFMGSDGRVRFIARLSLLTNAASTTSQVTFGDAGGGQLPFEPGPQLALDDLDLWNRAACQRVGGVEQISEVTSSETSFGTHTLQLTGLLHLYDSDCKQHTDWLTLHLAQPLTRLRELIIKPVDDPALPAAVLARELMDRVTVNRQKMPGSAFTQDSLIEKISHTIDFQTSDWVVKLGLSPTDVLGGWWVIGTSTAGSTDKLVF